MNVFLLLEDDDYDHTYGVAVAVYASQEDANAERNARNELSDGWLSYRVREFGVN